MTDLAERKCKHRFIVDGWVVTDSWTNNGTQIAVPNAWMATHYRCTKCLKREAVGGA